MFTFALILLDRLFNIHPFNRYTGGDGNITKNLSLILVYIVVQ